MDNGYISFLQWSPTNCLAPQVSMAKERKRLINEDLVQDVPAATHPQARDNPAQDRDRLTIRGNQIVVEGGTTSRPDLLN